MSKNTDSRCRDNDICLKIRTPKAETMIYSMFKNKDSRCRDNDTVYVLKNGHLNLRRDNDTITVCLKIRTRAAETIICIKIRTPQSTCR